MSQTHALPRCLKLPLFLLCVLDVLYALPLEVVSPWRLCIILPGVVSRLYYLGCDVVVL